MSFVLIIQTSSTNNLRNTNSHIVVDGGYVSKDIIEGQLYYARTHFGINVIVVIDDYPVDAAPFKKSTLNV